MLGPLNPMPHGQAAIITNRIGIIPKGNSGKWRLVMSFSHPARYSVNNAIDPDLCSKTYTTIERVAQRAIRLGTGALMAKVDIESAYSLVPVHAQDRPLLGITWKGSVFVDMMLPFRLRSAPKIFNTVAEAV